MRVYAFRTAPQEQTSVMLYLVEVPGWRRHTKSCPINSHTFRYFQTPCEPSPPHGPPTRGNPTNIPQYSHHHPGRTVLTLLLSPFMLSSSISSNPLQPVSRRHSPQKVPPPRWLPLTLSKAPSPSTFSMLTPEPMFTSRYGNRSESAAASDSNLSLISAV